MEVARAWAFARIGRADPARSATIDADVQGQFAALGLAVERDADEQSDAIDIWDINERSVRAFLDCGTQWRIVAGGSSLLWTGLDYSGVDVVLRHSGVAGETFGDIRVMEQAALSAFHEAQP